MSRPIQVELLTKPGCHLCDEMKAALGRAAHGLPVDVREVDISKDPSLEKRYGVDIPVLFIEAKKAFKHRATEKELRKRLEVADRAQHRGGVRESVPGAASSSTTRGGSSRTPTS